MEAGAVVYGAKIQGGMLTLENDYSCSPKLACKDACTSNLGGSFVTCNSSTCVALGTCVDECTEVIGTLFARCWTGASQTPLSASVVATTVTQFLDVDIRLPGTVTLYTCTNCTSAGAQGAFVRGLAFALGVTAEAVQIISITDATKRRMQLIMSAEFVTLTFHVETDRDVSTLLLHQQFPSRFALGVSQAGLFLPGLDQSSLESQAIFTTLELAITTAAPDNAVGAVQEQLRTSLLNDEVVLQALNKSRASMIGSVSAAVNQSVLPIDCTGVHGGPRQTDACGICGGDGSYCSDCEGVAYGPKHADQCGACDIDATNDCQLDCKGVWGGDSKVRFREACVLGERAF
eukprot:COSAG05_NODE_5421_length_1178_cov_14.859828_2_plen_347_part_01